MADDAVLPIPNLALPQHLFTLSQPGLAHLHANARTELTKAISADQMAPYYKIITTALTPDPALLSSMEAENTLQLTELDARLDEATKTEGESEISDALKARANYLTRIADKVPCVCLPRARADSA